VGATIAVRAVSAGLKSRSDAELPYRGPVGTIVRRIWRRHSLSFQ